MSVVAGAPPWRSQTPALGEGFFLVGEGAVGVEVQPRLLDELGCLHLADPARGGGDQLVGEQRRLLGEVGGLPGDQPGPPHRDLTGHHPLPETWESVGKLEGVGDQLPSGVVGDPERCGEVDGGELRDPRCTRTGEWDQAFVVQVGLAPVGGGFVGRAGVQPRPLECQLELLDGCLLLGFAGGADTVDHLGGGEGGCRGHGSILGQLD